MAVSESGRLLAEAQSRFGLTQRQLANVLGVSDRAVRAVLKGDKPGANLLAAAGQLAREGRVSALPVRRAQRVRESGGRVSTARVRTGGAGESARDRKSVV